MNKNKFNILKFSSYRFGPRLSLQEQAIFAKRLALLVETGIPLFKALGILKKQTASSRNRTMFEQILHDIENGQFLSKSMNRFQKVFGSFAINIVRVGETSGTLSENLKYLADEIDKKRKLRQKVTGVLVYPLVIMMAAFSISGLMTVYLFPKLIPVFKSLRVELPFMTRLLLSLSNFLLNYWFLLIIGAIVCAITFAYLMRLKRFRFAVNKMTLMIPIIGNLLKNYYLINMCRTLGILFKSRIHVLEAVTIAADTATNLVYQKELRALHHFITKGGSIAKHLEKHPKLFPNMLTQMIDIGETTGKLSDTLLYLAEIYEQELDAETKRLSSTIEPAMMLLMGLLVSFIALSIITPIYEVTRHLSPK